MEKMISTNNIINAFENFDNRKSDFYGLMFINIFKRLPHAYYVYFNEKDELEILERSKPFNYKKSKSEIHPNQILQAAIEDSKTNEFIKVFCWTAHEWVILSMYQNCPFLLGITIVDSDEYEGSYYEEIYIEENKNTNEVYDIIKNWFIKFERAKKIDFGITATDVTGALYTSWYDYALKDINIEANYNDDFPYEKICNVIESEDKPELMLFYGEPGTGKTSVIKHLIGKYPEKNFIFIDGTLLANTSKEKLMGYFIDNDHAVFILEDCEKSLVSRNNEYNPVMPVLLNLTDGIIGDVLGIKIICTFNTSLSAIDKALLRKGRLSMKYEFKKLDKKKVRKILNDESINEDMTLADIYYIQEENDFSKKNSSKIGFS